MNPLIKRYILLSLSAATAIILFYGIYQMTRGPELYKGDRLEERACRICQGLNKGCSACGYDGKVNVIIPSYNHQTTVYGEVFEQKVRHPSVEDRPNYDDIPAFRPGAALQQATAGAIDDAKVVFTSHAGKRVELLTPFTGKFTVKLLAGTYQVKVTKSGFQEYEQELVVPLATAEIWLEEIPAEITETIVSESGAKPVLGVPDTLAIEIGMVRE